MTDQPFEDDPEIGATPGEEDLEEVDTDLDLDDLEDDEDLEETDDEEEEPGF